MKNSKITFYLFLLAALTIQFSNSVFAQEKIMGEITITGISGAAGENGVKINGENVSSGRTIISPAEIETSAQATAKITLPNTGTILISPNTKMKLFFVKSGISGDFISGEAIFETQPGTTLSILTADGTLNLPEKNQANIVKLILKNGTTRLNTILGKAEFNTSVINAGEYYPAPTNDDGQTANSSSNTAGTGNGLFLLILLISGGVAAAALGLAAEKEDDSVSPVR